MIADTHTPRSPGRLLAWAALAVALVASVAANVAYARPAVGPRLSSSVAPILVILAAGLLERVPLAGVQRWRRLLAYLGLGVVIGAAFVTSFEHQFALLRRYGNTELSSALLPIAVDGLIVLASVCLTVIAERQRSAQIAYEHSKDRAAAVLVLQRAAEAAAGVPVTGSDVKYQACVYWALNDEGACLYIGQTADLARRIRSHRSSSPWASQVARWVFESYPSGDAALAAEKEAIKAEQPTYNVAHKPAAHSPAPAPTSPHRLGRAQTETITAVGHSRKLRREQVRTAYAAGEGIGSIVRRLNGSSPSRRTLENWTSDLREIHAQARATAQAALAKVSGGEDAH